LSSTARLLCHACLVLAAVACTRAQAAPDGPSPPQYGIVLKEARIPMPDGVELAADLWTPTGGATGERFPVLLEYLPYRKNEGRGDRYQVYSYLVQRGYVVARVDIRGTGESAGRLIEYEYTDQEQRDGEAVIAWLAAQQWSNGNVGMFGISWGAFNSIHMAMRNPPALKAIIAIEAADDLYEDDVHYIDGMMHADAYEFEMDIENAVPGAPDFRIDDDYFRDRFDTTPWFLVYKREQRDGPFWDRTSPNAHYDSIRIPTFLIGGWYDGYRDSVPRMLEHVKAPMKAMIGPWSHDWPSSGFPGRRGGVAARGGALVRSVAEGPRHRDHGRAALRRLRARLPSARHTVRAHPRTLALGRRLADRAHASVDAVSERRSHARREAGARTRAPAAVPAVGGPRGRGARHVVRRSRLGPAQRRRAEPRVRHACARAGRRDPRLRACASRDRSRRAARVLVRASLRRRARRSGDAGRGSGVQRGASRLVERAERARAARRYAVDVELHLTSWVFPKGIASAWP
jgi:hypothetical protein